MSKSQDETQSTYDWGDDEGFVLPSTAKKTSPETDDEATQRAPSEEPAVEAGEKEEGWEAAVDGPILVSRAVPEPTGLSSEPTPAAPPEPSARAPRDTESRPPAPEKKPAVRRPPPSARPRPIQFARRDDDDSIEKVGIVGGMGVGKSYLFQAIVYRIAAGSQSGALTYFLEKGTTELFASPLARRGDERSVTLAEFIDNYEQWQRLSRTMWEAQQWYRLRLNYRTGIYGQNRTALDIEFFDGSGEGFFERPLNDETEPIWRDGYLDARIMVFCLPLWVAFPRPGLLAKDKEERKAVLAGFQRVVQNFIDLRRRYDQTLPVRTTLALTMADDRRTALETLQHRWVKSFLKSPRTYLRQLRRGWGVARYLDNARRISEALRHEFTEARDPMVGRIPASLDFGGGEPWLIPVSAIEGSRLQQLEEGHVDATTWQQLGPPIPVHVELPILVTLCERDNALL